MECSACSEKCSIPSVMRLFVNILMATLLPSFVLVFWGIVGFTYSLVISLILLAIVFMLMAYISPLELKPNKQK